MPSRQLACLRDFTQSGPKDPAAAVNVGDLTPRRVLRRRPPAPSDETKQPNGGAACAGTKKRAAIDQSLQTTKAKKKKGRNCPRKEPRPAKIKPVPVHDCVKHEGNSTKKRVEGVDDTGIGHELPGGGGEHENGSSKPPEKTFAETFENELCAAECQFAKITTFPGDECQFWTANMSNTVLTEMNEFDVYSLKRLKELIRFLTRPPVSQVPPIAIQKKLFYLLLKTENDRELMVLCQILTDLYTHFPITRFKGMWRPSYQCIETIFRRLADTPCTAMDTASSEREFEKGVWMLEFWVDQMATNQLLEDANQVGQTSLGALAVKDIVDVRHQPGSGANVWGGRAIIVAMFLETNEVEVKYVLDGRSQRLSRFLVDKVNVGGKSARRAKLVASETLDRTCKADAKKQELWRYWFDDATDRLFTICTHIVHGILRIHWERDHMLCQRAWLISFRFLQQIVHWYDAGASAVESAFKNQQPLIKMLKYAGFLGEGRLNHTLRHWKNGNFSLDTGGW